MHGDFVALNPTPGGGYFYPSVPNSVLTENPSVFLSEVEEDSRPIMVFQAFGAYIIPNVGSFF